MVEKREKARIGLRARVIFGPQDPPEYMGLARDISPGGLCIATEELFIPGTILYLIIRGEEGFMRAKGMVMRIGSSASPGGVSQALGVRFLTADDGLVKIYNDLVMERERRVERLFFGASLQQPTAH